MPNIEIVCKNISGEAMVIEIDSEATVAELLDIIKETKPEIKQCDLYFSGKKLYSSSTLSSNGIQSESMVMMVAKQSG